MLTTPLRIPVKPSTGGGDDLETRRREYEWDYSVDGIPMLKKLPKREAFKPWYALDATTYLFKGVVSRVYYFCRLLTDPGNYFGKYVDMFDLMRPPRMLEAWRSPDTDREPLLDRLFAEQRIAGQNPLVIRLVTTEANIPERFEVEDKHLKRALGDDTATLERAIGEHKLFITDYSTLPKMHGGRYFWLKKSLPRPYALFYLGADGLQPVAIQVEPELGRFPVVTPKDGIHWRIARTCVQTADFNLHEMGTHLARTHLVMGPFAIATARQLPEAHPIHQLLKPHFKFMLALNDLGKTALIGKRAYADRVLAGTIEESKALLKREYLDWHLFHDAHPSSIERRGLASKDVLRHYPYRDDGKLVWDAIGRFVKSYVNLYYPSPGSVTMDPEIQAWMIELREYARVKGLPRALEVTQDLVDILTMVIFTCSAQHSSVNYSQYDYGAFAPTQPGALYKPIPDPLEATDQWLLRMLPPYCRALDQMEILTILAGPRLDRLGWHAGFADGPARMALRGFKDELSNAEDRITERNITRVERDPYTEYPFMLPSRLTNSISA